MPQADSAPRLPLVDNISAIDSNLPPINLFRAAANAKTLYPFFIKYMEQTFQKMELDSKIERLVILYVGKLMGSDYIWRQNVATAHAMNIPQVQIDTLDRGDTASTIFSEAQRAAFRFAEEAARLVEVTDPVYAEASRFFNVQAITELLYVTGTYMMLARIARTGRVPLDTTPADPSKYPLAK